MNPSWDWTEDDIQALIDNRVEESLTLDYKACDALGHTEGKKKEISKDVSAFANSAGGTIVYGVKEDKHVPTGIDVGYIPSEIAKEWIEQVINSNIQRRIDGVRINPVRLTGAAAGRVLYVVWVPQSVRAPHMAADHRFYKRFNFESVPMEEYEIRDVARRSEAPDLHVDLRVRPAAAGSVQVYPRITNRATEPALYASIRLYAEALLDLQANAKWTNLDHTEMVWNNHDRVGFRGVRHNWSVPECHPILEGEYYDLYHVNIVFGCINPHQPHKYSLGWEVRVPKAAPRLCGLKLVLDLAGPRIEEHTYALAMP
jgi:hypothetical protein